MQGDRLHQPAADWWLASDGNWYPPAATTSPSPVAATDPGPLLLTIGDIQIYREWVVTYTGIIPIRGTRWVARERTQIQRVIPSYAIVLAIVFFIFCLLGLLFLALKEDVMTGHVEVELHGANSFYHFTQVPVSNPAQAYDVQRAVAYVQQLALQ